PRSPPAPHLRGTARHPQVAHHRVGRRLRPRRPVRLPHEPVRGSRNPEPPIPTQAHPRRTTRTPNPVARPAVRKFPGGPAPHLPRGSGRPQVAPAPAERATAADPLVASPDTPRARLTSATPGLRTSSARRAIDLRLSGRRPDPGR